MKKIIIGMGGGYDIVVAGMLREKMMRVYGMDEIDIGGMLNPKFVHFYEGLEGEFQEEGAVNLVSLKVAKYRRDRANEGYLDYMKNGEMIHFVDEALALEVDEKVFGFSIFRDNIDDIEHFLQENYEQIIFCDVGGDILFFGEKDKMVKTPVMDAFSIRVAYDLGEKYRKNVKVLLLGIGLDGELPFENLKSNIVQMEQRRAFSYWDNIEVEDLEWLKRVYERVRYGSKGKTNQLLLEVGTHSVETSLLAKKRGIHKFAEWFNCVYQLDVGTLFEMNPITKARTYEEMKTIAAEKGVAMDRYY